MNRRTKGMGWAIAIGCLVLGVGTVQGLAVATSESSAKITWPVSFSGDITWTSGTKYSESGTDAENDDGFDFEYDPKPGWVNTTASVELTTASGTAETSNVQLYEEVWATVDGVTTSESFADAMAKRYGNFVANSDCWVTVTAYYALDQQLSTDEDGELSQGSSSAWVRVINMPQGVQDIHEEYMSNTVEDGNDFSNQYTGILSVSLWFDANDAGYFNADVSNVAYALPEPTTLGLVVLGGLALLRRKRGYGG